MLSVEIKVNEKTLSIVEARRTHTGKFGLNTYSVVKFNQVDDGVWDKEKPAAIFHREEDGAVALASQMLSVFRA